MTSLIRDLQSTYSAAQEIPERNRRIGCCQKATQLFKKIIYIPRAITYTVSDRLASATLATGKTLFHCMPNCIQKKYDNHCLEKARKIAGKVLNLAPAAQIANQTSGWFASYTSTITQYTNNTFLQAGVSIADWFTDGKATAALEAVKDPQAAFLKQTAVPLIKSAHELLAKQVLTQAYGLGIDTGICLALNQPQLMAALDQTLFDANKAATLFEAVLLTYVYGPTLYKAGALGVNLYSAHEKVEQLKKRYFSSPECEKFANDLAATLNIKEITGDHIIKAALFLLIS